jgi:integrase/recombinase XerC
MVVSINADLQPTQESSLVSTASSTPTNILADFLRLKISANTKRNYGKAIADFCCRIYNSDASISLLTKFLDLSQSEAVYQALQYRLSRHYGDNVEL